MKKILFCFSVYCCISTLPAQAVVISLTPEQVQSARAYGVQQKESIREKLKKKYCVGECDLFGERVIVRTKYYKLALMSALKAIYRKEFSQEQLSDILDDSALQIDVIVFGYKLDFARRYNVILVQGGKEIQPKTIRAYHSQNPLHGEKAWQGFPSYKATITTYFRYDQINPAGGAALVLEKDGKEKRFDIDLNKLK